MNVSKIRQAVVIIVALGLIALSWWQVLAASTGLLESHDGGVTWENINSPFTVHSLGYNPIANLVVAGTFAGGVYTYSP